jgi:hypothetical protein
MFSFKGAEMQKRQIRSKRGRVQRFEECSRIGIPNFLEDADSFTTMVINLSLIGTAHCKLRK